MRVAMSPTNHAKAIAETMSRELDAVRALRAAVDDERSAVERADAEGLRRAADLVRERSRVLADLARAREGALTSMGVPAGSSLETLVAHLRAAGANGDAVERIGLILRTEAIAVARAVAVVRRAAERLASHLAGVRSLITTPGGSVYGRRGRLTAADRSLAVDLRH